MNLLRPSNTPPPRLKHYKVGDKVMLDIRAETKHSALFVGRIEDGYYFLWGKMADVETRPWRSMAAASHPVIKHESTPKEIFN